jgi:hypothetical protein
LDGRTAFEPIDCSLRNFQKALDPIRFLFQYRLNLLRDFRNISPSGQTVTPRTDDWIG